MKAPIPVNICTHWRSEQLFNIDFASYTLSHHSFSRHFHDHYVIELVVAGEDSFYCNGKMYKAGNNQLVVINPGEVHTGSNLLDTPLKYFSLYPGQKDLQEIGEALGQAVSSDFIFQNPLLDHSNLAEKFRLLFALFNPNGDSLQQQEVFLDCMHALLFQSSGINTKESTEHKKDARVKLLIDFIRVHFKENLSLKQMAALVRLNPFHLIRLFKKAVGVSPYDYVINLRVEHSIQLLKNGCKVQDAALWSGFYDTSHLNRSMRKIAGTSPKTFLLSKSQFRTSFVA